MDCDKTNCWAHLEWLCPHACIIRILAGNQQYGDPYCHALTFVVRKRFDKIEPSGKRGLMELIGVSKPVKPCQYRAVVKLLYDEGWGVLITRSKNGKFETIELYKGIWEK